MSTMIKQLILRNDVEQISLLETYIDSIVEMTGIDSSMAMGLNLALEEAVTNVVLYAYPEGKEGLVRIDTLYDGVVLVFVITDSGIPFDPTQKEEADITLSVEERPIGGLGIFLVNQLMDTVCYERTADGYNVLTLTKRIH